MYGATMGMSARKSSLTQIGYYLLGYLNEYRYQQHH